MPAFHPSLLQSKMEKNVVKTRFLTQTKGKTKRKKCASRLLKGLLSRLDFRRLRRRTRTHCGRRGGPWPWRDFMISTPQIGFHFLVINVSTMYQQCINNVSINVSTIYQSYPMKINSSYHQWYISHILVPPMGIIIIPIMIPIKIIIFHQIGTLW
jgi:hypothetical protein